MVSQTDTEKEPTTPLEQMLFEIKKVIVGQEALLERIVVALLARGHILVEGVPGLAKTMAIRTVAQVVGGEFNRIQFTPDLLPADLIGTLVFNPREGTFTTKRGPIFTNFLLADEINRAPSKVQSALLEAMQERQVTIGRRDQCPSIRSSWSWRPRTRSSRRAPIRCPRRRSTASCSRSRSTIPATEKRWSSCSA